MAQSDPAPVTQDDDGCDKLFKLKHCRKELRDQYYGLVSRVWQWNNLEEGLSSVMKLANHSGSGNDDSTKKKRECLEEILANWERSFDEKIKDDEFSVLFAKCKEVLTDLKGTLKDDDISLTSRSNIPCKKTDQNKIRELIVLAKIQRQYLSKQCGNVETHKVCCALQDLYKILSNKAQEQDLQSLPGFADDPSKPALEQNRKKKKEKDTASSIDSDLRNIVDFVYACKKGSFLQNLEIIFPPEGAENIKDVIQWTEACVEAHGALIALSSIKELEKSTELYKTVKELFNSECSKVEAQQKIQKIMAGFTASFVYFFAKVVLLMEKINSHWCNEKELKQQRENFKSCYEASAAGLKHLLGEIDRCLPDKKLKNKGEDLKNIFVEAGKRLQLLTGEVDRHLQVKKKLQDKTKKLKKAVKDTRGRLQKMGICPPDTSDSPQDHLEIMEELSHILKDRELFSMLTECHNKVSELIEQRINLEKQLDLTAEERKEKKEKCEKILENCSNSLKDFIKGIKEDEIVTCMQCKKATDCRNVNQALHKGNLSMEMKSYIRSSLHAAYGSKEWQEIRMLKQVVESLKQGQEIEPEPRKYLIDLLSKWHEGCTKCKEAESCKIAKEALERVNSVYLFPAQRRFILHTLKELKEDSLYEEALGAFKKGQEVEGDLKQHLLEIVTEWYKNFRERGSYKGMEGTADTEHQKCVSIYEAYEAVKSYQGKGLFTATVHKFLLEEALSDPSECECCKKILQLSKTFEVLENDDLTEEQIKYLLEVFPETATCKRCSAMGTHKKNDESEKKYWKQLRDYLKIKTECENCQDMLQCMDVYGILSDNKELKDDEKTTVINLLRKFEDKWNCEKRPNCIKAIQILSDDTAKIGEDMEKYMRGKLKEGNPCEYDQYVLHESHELPSREYLRDFLLKNSCESCSILMEQFKVRKTLQENKVLAINLRDTLCEEFFPKTVQCKECHQWLDCIKMMDATETLSDNHIRSIDHILNITAGCKDCTQYDGDVNNSKLKEIVSKGGVAAKSCTMEAIKDRWERGVHCKVCHRKLMHLSIRQPKGNTEDKGRLKTFIRGYLKQFEHRLHCEVCEGFFVPEKPIVVVPLQLKDVNISSSGCSKAEDIKSFQQAASYQLKEQAGSIEDTFVYQSENKSRKRFSSGNSKQGETASDEDSKCEDRKGNRSKPASESWEGSSNWASSSCRNVGDVVPTPQLSASDQLCLQGIYCPEGKCDQRSNSQGSGNSELGGVSSECRKDEATTRQISRTGQDKYKTRPEPSLPQSGTKSASPDGDESEAWPPEYSRCYSKDDLDEHEGIDEVVGILQEWGKAHNVSLCILKKYTYESLEEKLREFGSTITNNSGDFDILKKYTYESPEGKLKEFRSTITNSSGDFDILVISRHLGIILVEMKAIEFTSTNLKKELGKAQRQLQKNEMVFYEMNRDWLCPSQVPVISLIAVPNKTCQQLRDSGVCQRDRQRVLSKCMIQYLKTKPRELDKLIGIPNSKFAFNDNEYYTLVARFLGLHKLIKYHCTDEGLIRDTGRKMVGMLLTKDQKSLIHSGWNPFQILAGDYGTGKSLMLAERAKMIANSYKKLQDKKKKIILISCTDITVDGKSLKKGQPKDSVDHLRNFIGDNAVGRDFNYFDHIEFHMTRSFIKSHNDGMDVVQNLEAAIAAIASSEDTELHILFDEMPLNFMRMFKGKIESLLNRYKSVIKTFWVSIATHSFRVTVLSQQDPKWIKNDCPEDFEFRYLKKNLRVPGRVLDLHKAIEWFNGDGHVDTKRGDIPLGPMPLLYRVPECVCASQSKHILTCKCSKFRVKETLKRLFIKIGYLQEQQGEIMKCEEMGPRSITVLLFAAESQSFRHDVCKVLLESCKEMGISTEDRTYVSPDGNAKFEEQSVVHHNVSDDMEPKEVFVDDRGNSRCQSETEDGKSCSVASLQAPARLDNPNSGSIKENITSGDRNDCKEESQHNLKILLTTETSFIGCESEVLICIDLNGMLHWYPNSKLAYTTLGISRCLSQYIHLTWMPSEAEKMFREQIGQLIQDGDDVEREDLERAFKGETCLEHVLSRILIEEQVVEMPRFVQE